jgi:hypothetical protein
MRRVFALAAIAAVTLGAGSGAAAPGPNGHNNYGLCTAYFAGSPQGRANKRNAPPFQALEEAAGVGDDDSAEEIDQKVREFCSSATPGGKGGTPGNPGFGQEKGAGKR